MLLPEKAADWPDELIASALRHELGHIYYLRIVLGYDGGKKPGQKLLILVTARIAKPKKVAASQFENEEREAHSIETSGPEKWLNNDPSDGKE